MSDSGDTTNSYVSFFNKQLLYELLKQWPIEEKKMYTFSLDLKI